jgi:hypothetical protein
MILDSDLLQNSEYQTLKEEKATAARQINYGFFVLIVLIVQTIYGIITRDDSVASPKAFYILTGSILAVYFGCLAYAVNNPKKGMMAAVIAIIAMYILFSMVYPGNLLRGLLIRIVTLIVLFRAHQAGERMEEIDFQIERLTERLAREKNG